MLLAKPVPQFDECFISYLIRVSEKNGFKHIGHLLHYAGLNWKNNRAPIHQLLSGDYNAKPLLSALGLPEFRSKSSSACRSFLRGVDTPYTLVKFPKVCPECLQALGYCKYQWAFLPVVACSKHKRMLEDVSSTTGKRLGWYRQYLARFDGEDHSIWPKESYASTSSVQQSLLIEALLSGKQPRGSNPAVLLGLELREALSLIHFIAHYQMRLQGGSFSPVAWQNYELAYVYENVWQALQAWPDSFYSLLSQYVDRPMSSKGQTGLNKHFRDLYERLHRQQENRGVARIKAEFNRYIEEYWPGVLEPERITRIQLGSATRNIISKKEVAHMLGARLERIDKLVQQGRITPVLFKGKAHYLRDQVGKLANELSSNWTMAEACQALEITRYQLKQLLDAGLIPVLQKPDSLNRDWVVDKQGCLALISVLRSNARKSAPPPGAKSLAGIQRQGYSIVQLVLAMQNGELQYGVAAEFNGTSSFKQFLGFTINHLE
ncbi:TniQ family protein [Teredinibacter turnerae]|uniref:TniQ family protein n=1 Tax=Teredinibacter turnerae TaxID=2426 RepID=UPI0004164CB6|nr:TniQ family protein [Teredinibacter turnerae]